MYINFINDRKNLGYTVLKDQNCNKQLITIFNSNSIIVKSILVRPEFLNKSRLNCEKLKYKIQRFYFIGMTVFTISTTSISSMVPHILVLLPVPQQIVKIEIKINESNSKCRDFLKIAPNFLQNPDKIVLSKNEITKFDLLAEQITNGYLTVDEAILSLRAGDGFIDLAAIMLFYAFINWLDGADALVLPHFDPVGWWAGSYNQPKGSSQCPYKYPFEHVFLEGQKMNSAEERPRLSYADRLLVPHEIDKTIFEGDKSLTKEYDTLMKSDSRLEKDFKKIEKLLANGHFTGGRKKGLQQWKGSKNIKYMGLAKSSARIYIKFDKNEHRIFICGYSDKAQQKSVTDRIVDRYDNDTNK